MGFLLGVIRGNRIHFAVLPLTGSVLLFLCFGQLFVDEKGLSSCGIRHRDDAFALMEWGNTWEHWLREM
jgi:hypothetical protein